MKYIILGQPRSGKSTLAKILSINLGIPIICTDKYRREWGFHEPWKGYSTEISNKNQKEFYTKLIQLYDSYDNVILEGSSINPDDIYLFDNDGVVLLYRDLTNQEMVKLSRKFDSDWTSKRTDEYLLKLFAEYIKFSKDWVNKHKDISINTTDFKAGLKSAIKKLNVNIKYDEFMKIWHNDEALKTYKGFADEFERN